MVTLLAILASVLFRGPIEMELGPSFAHGRVEIATPRPVHLRVEIAETPAEMAFGLMYRRRLAPMTGMLFDLGPRGARVSMWMKDTRLPLDMVFIGLSGRIEKIARNERPGSLELVKSPGPARAVLEIGAGGADRLGLAVGDPVTAFDAAGARIAR